MLKRAASLLKVVSGSRDVVDFDMVLDEMWSIAKQEMNFLMEADHNDEFRNLNREIDYVSCPQVDRHLTTVHVLVMEYIDGIQIDKLDELKAAGYDIKDIGVSLGKIMSSRLLKTAISTRIPIREIFGSGAGRLSGLI